MNHLTALACSQYVDQALTEAELLQVAGHIESCAECAALVSAYRVERQVIKQTLLQEDPALVPPLVMVKFTKPLGLREFALANVATGLVVWLGQFLWKTLFEELVIRALSWFSFPVPDAYDVILDIALYFSLEGGSMFDTYFGLIVITLLTVGLSWWAIAYRRSKGLELFAAFLLVGSLCVTPSPASALEHYGSQSYRLEAGETIDDTVVIGAETIVIDGNIDGDLVAFGERVVVNGSVLGNLIAGGRNVTVKGNVGGTVLVAGDTIDIAGSTVGGDFWGFASHVDLDSAVEVSRSVIVASELLTVAGKINKDLYFGGQTAELSGEVGRDAEIYSQWLVLMNDSIVRGDVRFRTNNDEALNQADSAQVLGEIEILPGRELEEGNRYASGQFYLYQVLRLVSAFLAGIVLFWLVPAFRTVQLEGGIEGVVTAGIGLISLVSVPIVGLLLGATVVGLPFAVLGLFAWLAVIYFAKVIIALFIGQLVLNASASRGSMPLTLLAGLLITIVVINLPGIGGVFNFLLTILGIGIIVRIMLAYTNSLYRPM